MCCHLRECLHLRKMTCDKYDLSWHASMVKPKRVIFLLYYCWWKKSCTTWGCKKTLQIMGYLQHQLVQDFFHQQYDFCLLYETGSIIVFACPFIRKQFIFRQVDAEHARSFCLQCDVQQLVLFVMITRKYSIYTISFPAVLEVPRYFHRKVIV